MFYGLFTILFWLMRMVIYRNIKNIFIYPFILFFISYLMVFLIKIFNNLEFKFIFLYAFTNYFLLGFWTLNIFLYI